MKPHKTHFAQEWRYIIDRSWFPWWARWSAVTRRLYQLLNRTDAVRHEYSRAVSHVSWMRNDKSLGLRIGANLLIDGVESLRRQRDDLLVRNDNQASIIRDMCTPATERERRMLSELTDLREKLKRTRTTEADD